MIADILYKRTMETPDKIFLYYNNTEYTYAGFNRIVNSISYLLVEKYSKKFLTIKIKDKLFFFATIIACNRSGIIPILLSENSMETADIDDKVVEKNTDKTVYYTGNSYNENDTQAVVFSSGTTGSPKGAELTFDNFYQLKIEMCSQSEKILLINSNS